MYTLKDPEYNDCLCHMWTFLKWGYDQQLCCWVPGVTGGIGGVFKAHSTGHPLKCGGT